MLSHLRNLIVVTLCLILISACGGGGGKGSSSDTGGQNGTPTTAGFEVQAREENPEVPPEFEGEATNNARRYITADGAFKTKLKVSGLNGSLVLKLNDELLHIKEDGEHFFQSTFVADTEVITSIDTLPILQECDFVGGVNSGYTQSDAEISFAINCEDSSKPSQANIRQLFSTEPTSISLKWDAAFDLKDVPAELRYKIYWSEDLSEVEDRTATSTTTDSAVLESDLSGLSPGTEYHIAVVALDTDANESNLVDIHALSTIVTPTEFTGTPFFVLEYDDVTVNGTEWTASSSLFSTVPVAGNIIVSVFPGSYEIRVITSISNVAGSYVMSTEEGSMSDIVSKLSISSDMAFGISSTTSNSLAKRRAAGFSKAAEEPPTKFAAICRSLETELEISSTDQIYFTPINKFEPRAINNLSFDFGNLLNPTLSGSFKYIGTVSLGAEIGFELSDSISGSVICELKGFPLSKTLKYSVYGLPVIQDISFDAQLSLSFSGEVKLEGSTKTIASVSFTTTLQQDTASNEWEIVPSLDAGYEIDNKLEYGATLTARAALLPKIETTLYKSATVFLKADAGVDADVKARLLGSDEPFAKFRTLPFLVEEFSSVADVKLNAGADLTVFGETYAEIPEREVAKTEPLRIFDTPLICSNKDAEDRDKCETQKIIHNNPSTREYQLEVKIFDGENNKYDLSSVEWHVTPDNGYIEVNKDDPRKAKFIAHDAQAYTVIASVDDYILKEAGRKYTQFSVTGECQYGLGKPLAAEYDKYWIDEENIENLYVGRDRQDLGSQRLDLEHAGYFFPPGIDAPENESDFNETCVFDNGRITVNYKGGQRQGMSQKLENGTGDLLSSTLYINGVPKTQSFYGSYSEAVYYYRQVRMPDSNIYNMLVTRDVYDTREGTRKIIHFDKENLSETTFEYYPNGEVETKLVKEPNESSVIEVSTSGEENNFHFLMLLPFSPEYNYFNYHHTSARWSHLNYYENGFLERQFTSIISYIEDDNNSYEVVGPNITCGWSLYPQGTPQRYYPLINDPDYQYYCRDSN